MTYTNCSVFLRYFNLYFRGYSYMITANLRHNLRARNFFQKKYTHAGSIVNTALSACCISHLPFLAPFLSNPIRASSVAITPSATISTATGLVLGGSSPSKYSSTMLAGVPSRVSRLHKTLDVLPSIPQEISMSIIQRGPR